MGRYRLPLNRVDRYAEYARLLLEMAARDNKLDDELVILAASYLDMAIRGRLKDEQGKV